jgi:nucleotide-binding universal stress UspA family protein
MRSAIEAVSRRGCTDKRQYKRRNPESTKYWQSYLTTIMFYINTTLFINITIISLVSICEPIHLFRDVYVMSREYSSSLEGYIYIKKEGISMFRLILTPIDGSKCAETAVDIAANIVRTYNDIHRADQKKGVLYLVTVVVTVHEPANFMVATPIFEEIGSNQVGSGTLENEAEAQEPLKPEMLEESLYHQRELIPHYVDLGSALPPHMLKRQIRDAKNCLATVANSGELKEVNPVRAVRFGIPWQEIMHVAKTGQVDLIVMASHGRTGFKRWTLGSVAEQVVDMSPIPVFIIHASNPPEFDPKHIRALVALDGSPLAEHALLPAVKLVRALATPGQGNAALHLACVLKQEDKPLEARAYLRAALERLQEEQEGNSISVTCSIVESEDVADALLNMAQRGDYGDFLTEDSISGPCDLIAMSTHGMGGWERWPRGSITDRVLHATKLPMLIVRPRKITK